MVDIDFLIGKTITMARYEGYHDGDRNVLTLHFDDDTLWGLAPDKEKPGTLFGLDRCVSFEESDAMSARSEANYEANVKLWHMPRKT
jgi:hypothetical protein